MRVEVARKKVRAGDRVHLFAKLRPGMSQAFCEVFVSHGQNAPAPYVSMNQAQAISNTGGSPTMVNAKTFRLSLSRPSVIMELVLDETCCLHLMQDLDTKDDATAIGKVYKYGKFRKILDKARGWFSRKL